jgi:hypothetical protein
LLYHALYSSKLSRVFWNSSDWMEWGDFPIPES